MSSLGDLYMFDDLPVDPAVEEANRRIFTHVALGAVVRFEHGEEIEAPKNVGDFIQDLANTKPLERVAKIEEMLDRAKDAHRAGTYPEQVFQDILDYAVVEERRCMGHFAQMLDEMRHPPLNPLSLSYDNVRGELKEKLADVDEVTRITRMDLEEVLDRTPKLRDDVVRLVIDYNSDELQKAMRKRPEYQLDMPERLVRVCEMHEKGEVPIEDDKLRNIAGIVLQTPEESRKECAKGVLEGKFGGLGREEVEKKIVAQETIINKIEMEKRDSEFKLMQIWIKTGEIDKALGNLPPRKFNQTEKEDLTDNLMKMVHNRENKEEGYYHDKWEKADKHLRRTIEFLCDLPEDKRIPKIAELLELENGKVATVLKNEAEKKLKIDNAQENKNKKTHGVER